MLDVILFFFFNDTATTEIYTLSLHDALPIYFHLALLRGDTQRIIPPHFLAGDVRAQRQVLARLEAKRRLQLLGHVEPRSEEHTSELQSRQYLVCRLLLEKKK